MIKKCRKKFESFFCASTIRTTPYNSPQRYLFIKPLLWSSTFLYLLYYSHLCFIFTDTILSFTQSLTRSCLFSHCETLDWNAIDMTAVPLSTSFHFTFISTSAFTWAILDLNVQTQRVFCPKPNDNLDGFCSWKSIKC